MADGNRDERQRLEEQDSRVEIVDLEAPNAGSAEGDSIRGSSDVSRASGLLDKRAGALLHWLGLERERKGY